MIDDKTHFHLSFGNHFPIDPEKFGARKFSQIQKNLRQFLFNELEEKGISGRYILSISGPDTIKSEKTFIDLQLYCPTTSDDKNISEKIIDLLFDYFNKLT